LRLPWIALTVCQAITIASTVVFPEPVAILAAMRKRPGLSASFPALNCSRMERCCGCRAATSSSQMIVSTASI
jgi:hypothetical protein